jgi:hypothetical protein
MEVRPPCFHRLPQYQQIYMLESCVKSLQKVIEYEISMYEEVGTPVPRELVGPLLESAKLVPLRKKYEMPPKEKLPNAKALAEVPGLEEMAR